MKTLCFFTDQKKYCGSEVMMLNILNDPQINKSFNTLLIYCNNDQYYTSVKDKIDEKKLICFNKFNLSNSTHFFVKLLNKYISFIVNYYRLKTLFKNTKIDILHLNNGGYPGAFSNNSAVIAAKRLKISKIIYSVHNMAIDYSRPSRYLDYFIDPIVVSYTDLFLTGSNAASAQLKKVLKNSNCRVLNTGTTVPIIKESKESILKNLCLDFSKKIVIVPANFERRKGHEILVDSISMLKDDLGDVDLPYFIFPGEGDELNLIKRKIRKLNLMHKVIFTGHLFAEYYPFLSVSDIVILPSISNEDFPNVIMEAMAYGKAIIASSIAGIPEQISNDFSGLLVEPGKSEELYYKLKELINNDQKINFLGTNAKHEFNKRFKLDYSLFNYHLFYNNLL